MNNQSTILVTGGAGFIGSHLVELLVEQAYSVVVLDKLTYAGDRQNLSTAESMGQLVFIQQDICDTDAVLKILKAYHITDIFHLAAESHVDNSIDNPDAFITTNVLGTVSMLKAAFSYWQATNHMQQARFIHVSTDEVFGHLGDEDEPFCESTPYQPNSPYSASKAASDHFASAWQRTYGLPVIITNCSNNFGPRQHGEKFIPTIIRHALQNKPIPIYGTGRNIRDWLYVKDHCQGLYLAFSEGKIGQSYVFGGQNEMQNLSVAKRLCEMLDREVPRSDGSRYESLLTFVDDRKGHDWRYAIDTSKVEKELGFSLSSHHDDDLLDTVRYYINKYHQETSETTSTVDLKSDATIDLAEVTLNYEGFRALAQNKHLSEHERLGFPDSYRDGFIPHILQDISEKLGFAKNSGGRLLDIGCGAGPLTSGLIALTDQYRIFPVLNDSPEMLNLVDSAGAYETVAGQFPESLDEVLKLSPNGYDSVLCYSVLHYIMVDHNIFDFIDAICLVLAAGGMALIGDVPNQSKRNRFFCSDAGVAYHKRFMNTSEPPVVEHFKVRRKGIDEAVLSGIVARAHAAGCHAYIVPQPDTLPMHNRRDDILIQKV